jgi:hypothetical protein
MGSPRQLSLGIPPHSQQQLFIEAAEREQLYGGAKRGGKSVALCQKIVLLSVLFPGNRGILARADMTDLKDTTLTTFWQVCPQEIMKKHHMGDRTIFIDTGTKHDSTIIYRGLGDANDVEKSKGIDLGWGALDEPSEIAFEAYLMLRAQLNWRLPDGSRPPYMMMLASNPEPGWVKERFIDEVGPDRIFIPSLPRQNPGLPPGWEDDLRANYPAEWVEKYLNGSWDISEGMVFLEWDDDNNTIDEVVDTTEWGKAWYQSLRLYESIDVASTGTTAYTMNGIDPYENHFVLAEHYQKDKLVTHHAECMLSIRYEFERKCGRKVEMTLIDPAATQRSQQRGNELQAMTDLYRAEGIMTIPAWNALEMGIEKLKQLIHVMPQHSHPISGRKGAAHLFVVRGRCPNLIKEFKGLKREVTPGGNNKYVGPDHALDTVRYVRNCMPRPGFLRQMDQGHISTMDLKCERSFKRWAERHGRSSGNGWFAGAASGGKVMVR